MLFESSLFPSCGMRAAGLYLAPLSQQLSFVFVMLSTGFILGVVSLLLTWAAVFGRAAFRGRDAPGEHGARAGIRRPSSSHRNHHRAHAAKGEHFAQLDVSIPPTIELSVFANAVPNEVIRARRAGSRYTCFTHHGRRAGSSYTCFTHHGRTGHHLYLYCHHPYLHLCCVLRVTASVPPA